MHNNVKIRSAIHSILNIIITLEWKFYLSNHIFLPLPFESLHKNVGFKMCQTEKCCQKSESKSPVRRSGSALCTKRLNVQQPIDNIQ